ncbi:FCD domain-containing protein [candidate division KSB3 bacterium]|uniref:FCD domain-containing protein n=1 Tax=candidate division KSB3 bacterium TaxID=2044937 RepID=A0A9D5Q853_9BACT|nr:FCD domain-containing protein [candidate division KSB3 bacterium]MBD3327630.1 FCD domain-containing protein [candidate division KSB3 bacterium]
MKMSMDDPLEYFERIELQDPADIVIQQIKDLISSGKLKPGEKLPSEQKMEERFGISRAIIRRALKRLDAFGIVKTIPQSGTYITGLGIDALGGLLSNVLRLEEKDYESLVETRYALEIYAVELAATTISKKGIKELEAVHQDFVQQVKKGIASFDEDLMFHIKIAEYSKNPILKSLVTLLASDVIRLNRQFEDHIGKQHILDRRLGAMQEHEEILEAMRAKDPDKAVHAMKAHYQKSKVFREHARKTMQSSTTASEGTR